MLQYLAVPKRAAGAQVENLALKLAYVTGSFPLCLLLRVLLGGLLFLKCHDLIWVLS